MKILTFPTVEVSILRSHDVSWCTCAMLSSSVREAGMFFRPCHGVNRVSPERIPRGIQVINIHPSSLTAIAIANPTSPPIRLDVVDLVLFNVNSNDVRVACLSAGLGITDSDLMLEKVTSPLKGEVAAVVPPKKKKPHKNKKPPDAPKRFKRYVVLHLNE
jgi:hypothetical protein